MMKSLDQDRNVMGYPYPNHQPPHNPGYSIPHQHGAYLNPSHDTRSPSLPNYPQHTISCYPNYPQQSYANYPIPTHGYPPTTPENAKGYSNVASFAYYKTKVYQPIIEPEHRESGSSLMRFLTLLLIIVTAALCVLTFLVWFLFGTQLPDFYVTSFTMPDFNLTGSELITKWEANVTITNMNEKIEVYLSKGRSSIFYDNKVLALAYIEPLHLKENEKGYLQTNLSTTEEDQTTDETLQHLAEDRKNGSIIFSLRMAVGARFKSNNWWRKEKLKVFCEDLKIEFKGSTGVGTLAAADVPHECIIFT